jgi:hypothetical protein
MRHNKEKQKFDFYGIIVAMHRIFSRRVQGYTPVQSQRAHR